MAMGLFLARYGGEKNGWRVESAGTWAVEGMPAAENTIKVVAQRGIDLSQHRSRSVTGEILDQFELILTMEQNQKEALFVEFPHNREKVYLLSEMINESYNICDPISAGLSEFEGTAEEIDFILERGYEKIREKCNTELPSV
jgi:protein-tyrosine-phosphatase